MISTQSLSMFRVSTLCAALLVSPWATAQPLANENTQNGHCGSGFTERFVPDQMFGCDMAQACKTHDVCYGVCGPHGSMRGSAYCKQSELSPERVATKNKCDDQFRSDISKINNGKCDAIASIYTLAVRLFGQGPFNGKPMPPQAMRDLIETSSTPDEAVTKFKALATEAKAGKLDLSQLKRQGDAIILPTMQAGANPGGMTLQLKQGASSTDIENAMEAWKNRQASKPLILNKASDAQGATK